MPGEHSGHQFCERGAECFTGTISFGNPPGNFLGRCPFQQGTRSGGVLAHRFPQLNFSYTPSLGASNAKFKPFETCASTEKAVIYFGKVVIFCREPENRNCVRSVCSQFVRQANRG